MCDGATLDFPDFNWVTEIPERIDTAYAGFQVGLIPSVLDWSTNFAFSNAVSNLEPRTRVDLIPVTIIDVTGLSVVRELATTLQARGVVVGTAGRQTEWDHWFARRGIERLAGIRTFPTLSVALEAYGSADGRKSGSS